MGIVRVDYRRLIVCSGLFGLLILLLRGCFYACTAREPEPEISPHISVGRSLQLYDADAEQMRDLSLEEYIAGVVAAEMPASFAPQALCAQAVAARTYTLHRIAGGGCDTSGGDICSDSGCCQAFDGEAACKKKWGAQYAHNRDKVRDAVLQTQGEALYYGGELIEALYHAASGGYTEDSENVFGGMRPYLRSVPSGDEIGSSHLTGSVTLSRGAFVKAVNRAWSSAKLNKDSLEEQVVIEERFASGRVKSLRLGGAEVSGRELRGLLELDSACFSISFSGDDVQIDTRGYGHGVGMSQTGANGMAQKGADYRAILAHYYAGAQLRAATL